MAYHVGRIIADRLDLQPVAVQVKHETADNGVFDYPGAFGVMPMTSLLAEATASDVLVCNPSFSDHLLGMRFPGPSLMYVQGVNTYRVIDGFFDRYVAVSGFVKSHLQLHYGWNVPVIAPFVHNDRMAAPTPWLQRPAGSVLVFPKTFGHELLDRVRTGLARDHPDVVASFTVIERMRHSDLLAAMQTHRYFLALSPLEGHPLTPIEAMLSGCCMVGFHGGGGLDFLRPGTNAATVGYPRIDAVIDDLASLIQQPARAQGLAAQGTHDVSIFDIDTFVHRWSRYVDDNLEPLLRVRRSAQPDRSN